MELICYGPFQTKKSTSIKNSNLWTGYFDSGFDKDQLA